MKKIVQIVVSNDDMLCLTEDGKVYERRLKDRKEIRENASPEHPQGRIYVKGTYYWKEVPVEEKF